MFRWGVGARAALGADSGARRCESARRRAESQPARLGRAAAQAPLSVVAGSWAKLSLRFYTVPSSTGLTKDSMGIGLVLLAWIVLARYQLSSIRSTRFGSDGRVPHTGLATGRRRLSSHSYASGGRALSSHCRP